jgi:hypothetical protein
MHLCLCLQETPLPLPPHWFVFSILSRDFTQPPPALPEGDEVRAWLEEAQVGVRKGMEGVGRCLALLSPQSKHAE